MSINAPEVSFEPWNEPRRGWRIGSYITQNWADTDAGGYWARVLECRPTARMQWKPEAEAILKHWDLATGTAWRRPWRDTVAMKVLKREHVDRPNRQGERPDFYKRFVEEARLLEKLGPTLLVNPLLELGYIKGGMNTTSQSFTANPMPSVDAFEKAWEQSCEAKDYPYLVLGRLPADRSIYRLLSISINERGVDARVPLIRKLQIAEGLLTFLEKAHALGIYYKDHKLEHSYWLQGEGNPTLAVIDFNSCTTATVPDRLAEDDVVNAFSAVIYPLFCGATAGGEEILPREVFGSGAVPDLGSASSWDAEDGLVNVWGQETRGFPELKEGPLRLLLSWGLSRARTRRSGGKGKAELGAQLAAALGMQASALELGNVATAAKDAIIAYRRWLQTNLRQWAALNEVCIHAEDAQRALKHARQLCDDAVEEFAEQKANPIVQAELERMNQRLNAMWGKRSLATD